VKIGPEALRNVRCSSWRVSARCALTISASVGSKAKRCWSCIADYEVLITITHIRPETSPEIKANLRGARYDERRIELQLCGRDERSLSRVRARVHVEPRDMSGALKWAREVLFRRGLDARADWPMLEYWLQVELFFSLRSGELRSWDHYGSFEQPYYTHAPRSGSKTNFKWVDLLAASPSSSAPERLLWLELKDLGRSPSRLPTNAWGMGKDMVALRDLDPRETYRAWRDPPYVLRDAARVAEWMALSDGIRRAAHLIGQVVVLPHILLFEYGPDRFVERWASACAKEVSTLKSEVSRSDTDRFAVFAACTQPKRTRT